MKSLKASQMQLLTEVIQKRQPQLLSLVESLGHTSLNEAQREDLRGAVAAEFSATGLDERYEPNPRGLLLEDLIDLLGHM